MTDRTTKDLTREARVPASRLIDQRIDELADWRGDVLARMRALIRSAVPEMTEEWKWRGTPVWSHHGIVCTGESYRSVVKLTFAKGASLPDPSGLFNAGLDGNTRRAIDIREGERVNARAFQALVRAAVALNDAAALKARPSAAPNRPAAGGMTKVRLLSGGNPRIAKAEGDAPVQAYISALSGWQHEHAERLDALIVRTVPTVQKAVKWNSPFYGKAGAGWFLAVHTYARYLRVTFFRGTSLHPVPPKPSKHPEVRYVDIPEDGFDATQFRKWIRQAAALPGWVP